MRLPSHLERGGILNDKSTCLLRQIKGNIKPHILQENLSTFLYQIYNNIGYQICGNLEATNSIKYVIWNNETI